MSTDYYLYNEERRVVMDVGKLKWSRDGDRFDWPTVPLERLLTSLHPLFSHGGIGRAAGLWVRQEAGDWATLVTLDGESPWSPKEGDLEDLVLGWRGWCLSNTAALEWAANPWPPESK